MFKGSKFGIGQLLITERYKPFFIESEPEPYNLSPTIGEQMRRDEFLFGKFSQF
jgi:hypothetical protein